MWFQDYETFLSNKLNPEHNFNATLTLAQTSQTEYQKCNSIVKESNR